MKIDETIKAIRLNLNFTQMTFAEELGVSFSTVNRWENGKSTPNQLAIKTILLTGEKYGIKKDLLKNLN